VKRDVWIFGLDPQNVSAFLAPYGWRVSEHFGCDELAERYVKPTGRQLTTLPVERVVYAEKA
jgi:O-methyltransferase involved in polyketide biosynthesis